MLLTVKRPVAVARPRAEPTSYKTLKSFKTSRKITNRVVAIGKSPEVSTNGGVDAAFKADVARIILENAELLRRLAK